MKKNTKVASRILLVIMWFLFICEETLYAQNTRFNQGVKLPPISSSTPFGYWSKSNAQKVESIVWKQNAVGYMKSLNKVKEILEFYGIDYEDTYKDESILKEGTDENDYEDMSLWIWAESAYIDKRWFNDEVLIIWTCEKDGNSIAIGNRNI